MVRYSAFCTPSIRVLLQICLEGMACKHAKQNVAKRARYSEFLHVVEPRDGLETKPCLDTLSHIASKLHADILAFTKTICNGILRPHSMRITTYAQRASPATRKLTVRAVPHSQKKTPLLVGNCIKAVLLLSSIKIISPPSLLTSSIN